MGKKGRIVSINISSEKGEKKHNVKNGHLLANLGLQGDAHAEPGMRQISLLANESIEKVRSRGVEVKAGDFAENLTVEGLDFDLLKVGTKLRVGKEAWLEITQLGKICHHPCRIFYALGDCIMPREGVFAAVIVGGVVNVNDEIEIVL